MRSRNSIRIEWLAAALLISGVAFAQSEPLTEAQADKLFEDAAAVYRGGDNKRALEMFDRLLVHHRAKGDRNKEGDVLYAQGWILTNTGAHAKALEAFTASLAIQREIGDAAGEVMLLDSQGRSYMSLRQLPQSIDAFEKARVISVRLGDRKSEAEALHNLGVVRSGGMQQLEQGLADLEQALKIRREIGDKEGEASDLDNAADTLKRLGRQAEALAYYELSLKLWLALADSEHADNARMHIEQLQASKGKPAKPPTAKQIEQNDKANDLNNECGELARSGAYAKAKPKCQRSVELFHASGDRDGESMALNALSFVLFAQSDYAATMEVAQKSLLLARQAGSVESQAHPLNQIGLVYMVWGQYPQALDAFERSLAIWRKVHDLASEQRTLGNIAGLHMVLGQVESAQKIWLDMLSKPFAAERTQLLMNLASSYAISKDFPKATEYFEQVLAIQRKTHDHLVRTTLGNLAAVYAESGQYDKAEPLRAEALALSQKFGDRMSEGGDVALAGDIQFKRGQFDGAMKSFEDALVIARELGTPQTESSLLYRIGEVHESQGRFEPAITSYQHSIRIEESLRAGGQSEEMKTSLGQRSFEVYRRAVRLQAQLGKNAEAFDLSERARARTFLDQLGNTRLQVHGGRDEDSVTRERELRLAIVSFQHLLQTERTRPRAEQDAASIARLTSQLADKRTEYANELLRLKSANPDYASLISVAPLTLAELQKLISADTTLVSYYVTSKETLAFVMTPDDLSLVRIPVSEADLTATVSELRGFANVGGAPSPTLAKLSSWLIAPLRAKIKTPVLGIIPHGPLHLVPFAALGADGQYLADAYDIFYLPGASTLPFIQAKRKSLSVAPLVLGQGRAEGLPPLKFAEREAEAVAKLYESVALTGGNATEKAFRDAVGSASVLHLAAHGQLNPVAPLFSRLVLAADDPLDPARDGYLEVREIYALDLRKASLVVLSACQTQLGVQSTGDEIVGLARAFIYAGTPSVVASLWSVDDVATSELITAFHRHLRAGKGKAAALRAAQKEIRARFPDPYYWAAFVLTGDPG